MNNTKTKQVSIVMAITVASKLLGFLRDIVLANYYGASSISDAFFVAQTIPEFLFSLVVQSISIGFIPIYIEINEKSGREKSNDFTNKILKICLLLSVALIVFVNVFTREIVAVFAHGFDAERIELTVRFTRIAVFSMIFRITVSVYSSYLNANNQFTKPAFNGIVLDVVMIASIVISAFTSSSVLAWGMIAATFFQFVLLCPNVIRTKTPIDFSLKNIFDNQVKQMTKLFLPVVLGVGAGQINVLADRTMASSIPGAISSLNYANKVDNVLENIIILSLATVIFPSFSRNVSSGDYSAFQSNIRKSIDVVSFTMIPCSFLSFVFSDEIIQILFARGAFDIDAIESSSTAMKFYSVGLLFLSYNAILNRAFYAMKKVRVVSFVSCGTVAVNILMNFLLKPAMGIGGLALATSISNIFATCMLTFLLCKNVGSIALSSSYEIIKAVISSVVMAALMCFVSRMMENVTVLISFAISACLGGVAFLIMEWLLQSTLLKTLIKRGQSIIAGIR